MGKIILISLLSNSRLLLSLLRMCSNAWALMTWNKYYLLYLKKFAPLNSSMWVTKIECFELSITCWKEFLKLKITLFEANCNSLWQKSYPSAMTQVSIIEFLLRKVFKLHKLNRLRSIRTYSPQMESLISSIKIFGNSKDILWIQINFPVKDFQKLEINKLQKKPHRFTKLNPWSP